MECIGDFCCDPTKILGQGSGFGIVFKGWKKQQPSVQVAVKRIEKKRISEEVLDREIEVLRELSVYQHENVVALLDIKKTETSVVLIMEFCNGGNLADYLRHKRTLSENTLSSFMQQIASALKAMKDKGIMHRDLKPQNILICYAKGRNKLSTPPTQLQLKIADFGLARVLEEGKMASTLCGSAVYMAPEVIKCEKYDFKVDLWSVGTLIFECLTGEVPFVKEIRDLRAFYEKNVDLKPEIPEDASPELKNMLQRLLTINAAERIDIEELLRHPFLKRFKRTLSKRESTCEKKGSTVRTPLAEEEYNGCEHAVCSVTPHGLHTADQR